MYKQLNSEVWNDFGYELLDKSNKKERRNFLLACRDGNDAFLDYVEAKMHANKNEQTIIGDKQTKNIKQFQKLTECEFRYTPKDVQEKIWNCFSLVSNDDNEILYYCGYWGYICLEMLKNGSISSPMLARRTNSKLLGLTEIDNAITAGPNDKAFDDCIRTVLRSLCNKAPRGERDVFEYHPLSKSYWCWKWSELISENLHKLSNVKRTPKYIRELLFNRNFYNTIATKMYSGRSYISSINLLCGLFLFIDERLNNDEKLTPTSISNVIYMLSYTSALRALEIQKPDDNKKIIDIIVEQNKSILLTDKELDEYNN